MDIKSESAYTLPRVHHFSPKSLNTLRAWQASPACVLLGENKAREREKARA